MKRVRVQLSLDLHDECGFGEALLRASIKLKQLSQDSNSTRVLESGLSFDSGDGLHVTAWMGQVDQSG